MTPIPAKVKVVEDHKGIPSIAVTALLVFTVAPLTALLMHSLNQRQQHTVPVAALRIAEHVCKQAGGAKEMRVSPDGRYTFVCFDGTELPNARLNIVPRKLSF